MQDQVEKFFLLILENISIMKNEMNHTLQLRKSLINQRFMFETLLHYRLPLLFHAFLSDFKLSSDQL